MNIKQVRRANLFTLLAETRTRKWGGVSEFAQRLGTSQSHISQILGNHSNMGDAFARKCEQRFRKPAGWMDRERGQRGLLSVEETAISGAPLVTPAELMRGITKNSKGRTIPISASGIRSFSVRFTASMAERSGLSRNFSSAWLVVDPDKKAVKTRDHVLVVDGRKLSMTRTPTQKQRVLGTVVRVILDP